MKLFPGGSGPPPSARARCAAICAPTNQLGRTIIRSFRDHVWFLPVELFLFCCLGAVFVCFGSDAPGKPHNSAPRLPTHQGASQTKLVERLRCTTKAFGTENTTNSRQRKQNVKEGVAGLGSIGMGWGSLECIGVNWNGLGFIGMDWGSIGMGWSPV